MNRLWLLSGTLGAVVLLAAAQGVEAGHRDCHHGYSIGASSNLGYSYLYPSSGSYGYSRPYYHHYESHGDPYSDYYYSPQSGFGLGVNLFGFGSHNYGSRYRNYGGFSHYGVHRGYGGHYYGGFRGSGHLGYGHHGFGAHGSHF